MTRVPQKLELKSDARTLAIAYANGGEYELSAEFLRVHSPSAEVRGHGKEVLQTGKQHVTITGIEAVGNYAIKITFSDGHDSGIYSWPTLLDYCENQDQLWQGYVQKLAQAGASRTP